MIKEVRFELARQIESDAKLVMQWRNDDETRRLSIHTELKKWPNFYKDYLKYFYLKELPPLFIIHENKRVGFVFFKPVSHPSNTNKKTVEVSINISPEYRGKGLGKTTLIEIAKLAQEQDFEALYAVIKKDNLASIHAFLNAGFIQLEDTFKDVFDLQKGVIVSQFIKDLFSKQKNVFIIGEAGSNWRVGSYEKDLEMSKKLIEIASDAGCDAVKFQVFKPDTIYVKNAGMSQYLKESGIKQEMQEIFQDLMMPYEMIPLLAEHAKKCAIEFMATAFSKEDFLAIDPYVKYHKIASYEIGHLRLIELIAKTKKTTFISTGASTIDEIDWVVDTFKDNGGGVFVLLQCTAKYPAESSGMNLNALNDLKSRFKCAVGLSDHSLSATIAPIVAVSLGATVIEKHFTFDKKAKGPDHAFALNPQELKEMIIAIRETEKMLGSHTKVVHLSEMELRKFAKRGLQAILDIQKGDILKEDINVAILRPGEQMQGIHPKHIVDIEGKKATRNISLGNGIQQGDWK